MKREYHRWYSHRLGLEMGVVVYGHWGPPLLGFPTSAGDEWELEGQGLIGSLAPLIDAGRVKFFSVNSVNSAGFYNKGAHPFHRSYVQAQFDAYVREEVVPFIRDNCQSWDIAISTMGASFGAYHAANTLFKHPDVVRRCFALSGVYDMKNFMDGMYDDNTYFNNPVDYLSNADGHLDRAAEPVRHSHRDRHRAVGAQRAVVSAVARFLRARGFIIIWTIGDRRAGTTGRTGSIRCGNTSRSCFSRQASQLSRRTAHRQECLCDLKLRQAESFQHVAALRDYLLVVDPDVAAARQDVDVRASNSRRRGSGCRRDRRRRDGRRGSSRPAAARRSCLRGEVGAEGQLADAVAVLVGVAVVARIPPRDPCASTWLSARRPPRISSTSGVSCRSPYLPQKWSPAVPSQTKVPSTLAGVVKTSPAGRFDQ